MTDGLPTLAEMAANFAVAVAAFVRGGFPVVTREQYEARVARCGACVVDGRPGWTDAGPHGRCSVCGCFSVKRWISTERCPAGRWGKETHA